MQGTPPTTALPTMNAEVRPVCQHLECVAVDEVGGGCDDIQRVARKVERRLDRGRRRDRRVIPIFWEVHAQCLAVVVEDLADQIPDALGAHAVRALHRDDHVVAELELLTVDRDDL